MGSLNLRLFDADRRVLTGPADIEITHLRNGTRVVDQQAADASAPVKVTNLEMGAVYEIRVFPVRHRPVGQLATVGGGAATNVHLFCPVHPDRARAVFPDYDALPGELRTVLERSRLETDPAAVAPLPTADVTGRLLFDGMTDLQKAGLLNVFRKMTATRVGPSLAWDFVTDVYRSRGDRIFANVTVEFRDHVKSEVSGGRFEKVSGAAHTPDGGFEHADSFKTGESLGNLQLTFFCSTDAPKRFRVDADIDDARGIGHAFQVLRNFVTDGQTHPYDIHQVMTFHQRLRPGYDLTV